MITAAKKTLLDAALATWSGHVTSTKVAFAAYIAETGYTDGTMNNNCKYSGTEVSTVSSISSLTACKAECDKKDAWSVNGNTITPTTSAFCLGVLWTSAPANTCSLRASTILDASKTGNGDANKQCAVRIATAKGKDWAEKMVLSATTGTSYKAYIAAHDAWAAKVDIEDQAEQDLAVATAK